MQMKNFWIIVACVAWFVIGLAVTMYEQGEKQMAPAEYHDGMY
jgi:hypothetical protein